jgi:hypothetical protein
MLYKRLCVYLCLLSANYGKMVAEKYLFCVVKAL